MPVAPRYGAVLLAGFLTFAATSAIAQEPSAHFYYSGGRQIPLKVFPDVLAVQGYRSVARAADRQGFAAGVAGYVDEGLKYAADFDRENVFFVRTEAGQRQAVQRDMIRSETGSVGLAASVAVPGVAPQDSPLLVVTPEFVARFKPGVTAERIDAINAENRVEVVRKDPFVPNQYLLRSRDLDAGRTLDLSIRYYGLAESDKLAHPNFIRTHVTRGDCADPLFPAQWHLENTGQGGGVPGADVRAQGAWTITEGSPSIVVAIIDADGVQINHEDLRENKFINPGESGAKADNGADDDGNGFPDDVSGWNFDTDTGNPATDRPHGTAAAGVAVARAKNGRGVRGVAPNCKLLAIKTGRTDQDDADAFRYAALMKADVISCSWGYPIGTEATQLVEEAIADVARTGRGGKGCPIFFALSNQNLDNFGGEGGARDISSLPDVIAVGRSTNNDIWGRCGFGKGMALLAPTGAARGSSGAGCESDDLAGTLEVVTTDLMGPSGYNKGQAQAADPLSKCGCNPQVAENSDSNYTSCFHGTSSATPLVAGVAALVLSVDPDLRATEVRDILISTAETIDVPNANYHDDGHGRLYSITHGYGRVDARAAVSRAKHLAGVKPEAVKSRVTLVASQRATAAPADAPTDQILVGGRPAERATITICGKECEVFALKYARGLLLAPKADRGEVLRTLGDPFRLVHEPWSSDLEESRRVLVVECGPAAWKDDGRAFATVLERGLVESIGRIIFFDRARPLNPVVLTDQVSVRLRPHATVADLRRHHETDDVRIVGQSRLDPKQVTLAPGTKGADPLRAFRLPKAIEASGLVDPERTQPRMIVPMQRRKE